MTRVKDGNEAVALLEKGSLDAFASDKVKLVGLAVQAKDPKALAILGEDLSIEPLAFALPRGDSAFRLEVNRALTQVYVGGELESIFQAWLGPIGRPSGILGGDVSAQRDPAIAALHGGAQRAGATPGRARQHRVTRRQKV